MRPKKHFMVLMAALMILPLQVLAKAEILLNLPGYEELVEGQDVKGWINIIAFQTPLSVADEVKIPANLNTSMDLSVMKFMKGRKMNNIPQDVVFSAVTKAYNNSTLKSLMAFLEKKPGNKQWRLAVCTEQGQMILGYEMKNVMVTNVKNTGSGLKIEFKCQLMQWWEKVLR